MASVDSARAAKEANVPHGEELMSGYEGNVPRGEPFDAGNMTEAEQRERLGEAAEGCSSTQQAAEDDGASASNYRHDSATMFSGENRETDKSQLESGATETGAMEKGSTGLDSHESRGLSEGASKEVDDGAKDATASQTTDKGASGAHAPAVDTPADNNSAKDVTEKNTTEKSTSEPATDAPASSDKPSAENDNDEGGDPNTGVMGDGPKPLDVVAKDHGGDAGNSGDAPKETGGAGVDEEGGEGASQESKGTGEQYVRTTGFAADGGDFDATKPGAGREADRLMEEKGITREGGGLPGPYSGGDSDKPSLGERIKNKLHKH